MTEAVDRATPRPLLATLVARDYADDPDAAEFATGIDAQVAAVRRLWCSEDLGERALVGEAMYLRNYDDVEDAIRDLGLRTSPANRALLLYVAGHGLSGGSGDTHYLVLPESSAERLVATAYPTVSLVSTVVSSSATDVVVVVNACYAGTLIKQLATIREDLDANRRDLPTVGVFVTADFDRRLRVGEFTRILERVNHQLRGSSQYSAPYLTLDQFHAELTRAAAAYASELGKLARDVIPIKVLPARAGNVQVKCLPNPGYRASGDLVGSSLRQVADTSAEINYWIGRASGRTSDADQGWYFAGRRDLMKELGTFLRGDNDLLVVTGSTGSGKSALIARVVTLSDRAFRSDSRFQSAVTNADPDTLPEVGSVDAAVLARNLDVRDVCVRLLSAFGAEPAAAGPGEDGLSLWWDQLRGLITAADRRLTLVIDGVDEALAPGSLVVELLGPLIRSTSSDGKRNVRLIVALRSVRQPTTAGDADTYAVDDRLDRERDGLLGLLNRVGAGARTVRIQVDGPGAATDIAFYVTALLGQAGSPYAGETRGELRRALAGAIADRVAPSFLDARLASRGLIDRASVQDPHDPAWLSTLAEGTVALLREDLRSVATSDLPDAHLYAILRAAAFGAGAGLPWSDVWPAMAEAVYGDVLPYPDDAIRRVLYSSRLSGYLTRDSEDGVVVHRIAHERLAEILRREPALLGGRGRSETPPSSDSKVGIRARDEERLGHRAIAEALLRLVPASGGPEAVQPYVWRYLARHAALGGVLDDAHVPSDFLPLETSGQIRGLLGLPIPDAPEKSGLAAWATIEPYLGAADPFARRLSHTFARAVTCAPSEQATAGSVGEALRPVWAQWALPSNVLAHFEESGTGLASVSINGRTLIATGGDGGVVRLWDPMTATEVTPLGGRFLTLSHLARVLNMFAIDIDDRTLLLSVTIYGYVELWDPATGSQARWPREISYIGARVLLVQPVVVGSTIHIVSVDGAGAWLSSYPATDQPIPGWQLVALLGHEGRVSALSSVRLNQGTVIVTGGTDATIRLWHPETAEPIGEPFRGHIGAVTALCEIVVDGRVVIASGGVDGTVRLWDPVTAAQIGMPLACDGSAIRALCQIDIARPGVVGIATAAGAVASWDTELQRPLGSPARVNGVIHAMCSFSIGGKPFVATSSSSTGSNVTVQVWDPTSGTKTIPRSTEKPFWTSACAVNLGDREHLATSTTDGPIWLWDLTTGEIVGQPLLGHRGLVLSLCELSVDGATLLASGGSDGTVRLWDPEARSQVGDPLIGHQKMVSGLTVIRIMDRPVIASTSLDGTIRLWDPCARTQIRGPLSGHERGVVAICTIALDGGKEILASGGMDAAVRLWDPIDGSQIGELTGHARAVTALCQLSGGATPTLATAGVDSRLRLWDANTGREIGRGMVSRYHLWKICPVGGTDRRVMICAGLDGTVRLVDLTVGIEKLLLVTGSPVSSLVMDRTISLSRQPRLVFVGDAGVAMVEISQSLFEPSGVETAQ